MTRPIAVDSSSPFAPLHSPGYRLLWIVILAGNLGVWMNDVAAAWVMTSLTTSPVMVALVQTATTLPIFLFCLPAGALSDMLDRRRVLIVTQIWFACVAVAGCFLMWSGAVTGLLLLLLTFANGIGVAMRYPNIAALVPQTVPRAQLPAALGLQSVAMNTSRLVGPALAGLLIVMAGSTAVYVANAVIAIVSAVVLLRWRHRTPVEPVKAPAEPIWTAMGSGVRFIVASRTMRAIVQRAGMYFAHGIAMIALLPLVARQLSPGSPTVYAMLLGALGVGSIFTAMVLVPMLRRRMTPDRIFLMGNLFGVAALTVLSLTPWISLAFVATFCAGISWTASGYTLTVQAQLCLPNEVRARGMAVYQVVITGGNALGAALWGTVASFVGVMQAMQIAAVSLAVIAWIAWRLGTFDDDDQGNPSARGAGTATENARL